MSHGKGGAISLKGAGFLGRHPGQESGKTQDARHDRQQVASHQHTVVGGQVPEPTSPAR